MSDHEAADAAAGYMRPLEAELGPSEEWPPACRCGPGERCFDCATDDELLVALGYEPLEPVTDMKKGQPNEAYAELDRPRGSPGAGERDPGEAR
jgi:hypothetical protein